MWPYLLRKIIRPLPGLVIRAVPKPEPALTTGFRTREETGAICRAAGVTGVLLVTDRTLASLGYHEAVVASLSEAGIPCTVFSDIASEPTEAIVEAGRAVALACSADCIVALGGGSVLDSSKMIAAGARLSKRPVGSLLRKFLFVRGKTLPLLSIPSTAGTGAEITVGAVVTGKKGTKCSTVLVGLNVFHVILDSELTVKAPRGVTAACGIDALSHGLEGMVAAVRVPDEDMEKSRACVRLVLSNLPSLLRTPEDESARLAMCRAAYYGGNAINKQLAGYIHAFAHSIGARYHIPHGEAIALSLLPVLHAEKEKCLLPLASLSFFCGTAGENDTEEEAAWALLERIRELIAACAFPPRGAFIPREDYPALARMIAADSINYSSPVTMTKNEIFRLLDKINAA